MKPGIYFDLPEDEYHADPALSYSGIKKLRISPLTYWADSPMNPDFEERKTDALLAGKAYETRIIDGRAAFNKIYAATLSREGFPNLIAGGTELAKKCADLGLTKGGSIDERCQRILQKEPTAELWPVLVAQYEGENEGKIFIDAKEARHINFAARLIEQHPDAADAFTGGHAQVSIFWNDKKTGVPMRSRLDYLKINTITDLKTFANINGAVLDVAVTQAIARYRYFIQAVVYLEAVEEAKEMICREGETVVHGNVDRDWLKQFSEAGQHRFIFVFQEKGPAPNIRVREFSRETIQGESLAWDAGMASFRQGVKLYSDYQEQYGTDPWIENDPSRPIEDEEFPLWMME